MKNLIKPFALFSIVALLISCKDEQQVKVEKLTESYSKYLDSLTLEKSEEIVSKWNEIENEFNNKTTALKNEINQLDDKDDFEKKFAAVGIRYEDFKKDILVKKAEIDAKNAQLTRNKELFGSQFIHDDMKFEWVNKDNILAVYDQFVTTVQKNKDTYSREDWDEIKLLYEALDSRKNTVEKQGLTSKDNMKIAGLKLKFAPMYTVNRMGAKSEENANAKK
ncbi:DUF6565 domain-containing protein [Flavobacterium macrobrachii]|jgi:hypothetical protein|uniref:DUF6565 domain-containing protein n=1 Tax=Flavobacterium macrobrachii TaxID=591204 RepID=A0ABS2CUH6_9FLAO|nr:DUF6565 domain-containing protein [Flavobacterium macrobrachii]MBM6498549.1 hypothetical protein [Flavobacterium macrobrachii]PZO27204.1 MAG: hypothetical protein DCF13_12195 [Flavobacteriaceae bacterium]